MTNMLKNVFEKAYIKTVLTKYAQEKGWVDIAESRRLLSTTDLTNLGITKNDKGVYEILGKNSFAAPIYSAAEQPFMYRLNEISSTHVLGAICDCGFYSFYDEILKDYKKFNNVLFPFSKAFLKIFYKIRYKVDLGSLNCFKGLSESQIPI